MVTNTRDRGGGGVYPFPGDGEGGGVQVMGNEHMYPLVLWEWGRDVTTQ